MNGAILLALGSNQAGRWGPPRATIVRCKDELSKAGFRVAALSGLYETAAVGPGRAGVFVNAAVAGDSHLRPEALLRLLKRLERRAGGRSAMPWGPRSLDVDILAYKGRVIGWPRDRDGAIRGPLVVPHPRLHARPFVLRPLLDIAPDWRHPVLGRTAGELWRRVARQRPGRVLRRVEAAVT